MSFWAIFCNFTTPPLIILKIKILKKNLKNAWRYYPSIYVYHKWRSYVYIWFLIYKVWQTEICVILGHFLPFYTPNNLKNQDFEKMKKTPGDIIILNMCTINDNHMMCGSWDSKRNGPNVLLFWTIFCPFTPPPPLTTQKIKITKKWKKTLNILSFYKSVPQMTIIWCMVP